MNLERKLLAMLLAGGLFLSCCTKKIDVEPVLTPVPNIVPSSTSTLVPPGPTPTIYKTAVVLCDPATTDYCILDGHFILQRPISPPGNSIIDRTYAYASTAGGTNIVHHGVEFPNATGVPVQAASDGVVFYAGDDSSSRFGLWDNFYGNLVVLKHTFPEQTLYTLYAHLSSVSVITGQSVHAGEKLGEVGATGSAIGSHLHFEVRLDATDYFSTLNPELWLEPNPGTGVLAIRLTDPDGGFLSVPVSIQQATGNGNQVSQARILDIYPEDMSKSDQWENAAIGGLVPGQYRITFIWEGVWQERWVSVQDGKLTEVEFTLSQ